MGLTTAALTPFGQSPDEPAHLARAAGLLHWAVIPERRTQIDPYTGQPERQVGVKVDTGLLQAGFAATTISNGWRPTVTLQDYLREQAVTANHAPIIASVPNTGAYFPVAYVPAALGLAVGLALKLSPYASLMLARLLMLAVFLFAGALALRVAAYGEALLLCVLILPMTLFLAGTLNQDGLLIALTCLACAAATRGTNGGRVLGLALFVVVLGSKPLYLPLLGMFLLPLCGARLWRRAAETALASLPVLAWVAVIVLFVVVPFNKGLYHPGPLYQGDRSIWLDHTSAAANLHILLAQPARFVTLPAHTLAWLWQQKLREMIGVLGMLQISLPSSYYGAWGVCGVAALLGLVLTRRPVTETNGMKLVNLLWGGFLLVFTAWLVMIQFYLNWSNVGLDYIDGTQGRYALVLLPFLLFAVPGFRWRFTLPPLVPALPAVAMGVYGIGYIPFKLAFFYYVR